MKESPKRVKAVMQESPKSLRHAPFVPLWPARVPLNYSVLEEQRYFEARSQDPSADLEHRGSGHTFLYVPQTHSECLAPALHPDTLLIVFQNLCNARLRLLSTG
jgi:hypothetical protein